VYALAGPYFRIREGLGLDQLRCGEDFSPAGAHLLIGMLILNPAGTALEDIVVG
jgi:hypothetical protein